MSGRSEPNPPPEAPGETPGPWLTTARVLMIALAGVALWVVGDVLLLIFAGLLIAVGLDGLAGVLARRTPLPRGWALGLATALALAGFVAFVVLLAPQIVAQLGDLWPIVVDLVERAQGWLDGAGIPAERLMNEGGGPQRLIDAAGEFAGRMAGFTLGAVGAATSGVLMLAIAIFAAADPGLYRRGFLGLLPAAARTRFDATLSAIALALRWWFLGQIVSMLALGVTVGGGLWIIGVEQWLTLGLLTAVLTFVPVIGPFIAGVPVVIVGFAQGTEVGLIVLVFYLVVQNLEGNFLIPIIMQQTVHLPPALLIASQVLLTVLFGIAGLILAAPLTVVGMIAAQKLYVEGVLGRETDA